MPSKKDAAADKAEAKQPKGAPELDGEALDKHDQQQVEDAFVTGKPEADVDAELPDDVEPVEETPADVAPAVDTDDTSYTQKEPPQPNLVVRFFRGYWSRKAWTLPLTFLALLGILAAVPASRYAVAATFMKQDVQIKVIDDGTKQPVSSAAVSIDGVKAMTDNKGLAKVKARVGDRPMTVSKKYYSESSAEVFVPIGKMTEPVEVFIKPTGRQVPVAVVNRISGKPLENVTLKAAGTEIKTGKDGKAVLVLPADKPSLPVELSAAGFNAAKATVTVTETVSPQNTFQVTPSGKVYFLSKQSGKIDVVKTDLDGTNRQIIIAGTGREEEQGTVLLASRDWKYLALLSRRDSDKPKLYLITTADGKMEVMDEGKATFSLLGWSEDTFVYYVGRYERKAWQPGGGALKSYKVANAKLTTLDETEAEGDESNYKYMLFQGLTLIGDKVLYNTYWSYSGWGASLEGKNAAIRSVSVNGQGKKDLKVFPVGKYYLYEPKLYAPGELYYMFTTQGKQDSYEFLEYENGTIKTVSGDHESFFSKAYPTYLESPDKKRTFWSEQRDGKETFFVGTADAGDPKQVAVLPEHQVYGWYTDDYLLVSKKGSELFIMPVDGSKQSKITDYHKPNTSFRGYGGGYGGL